MNVHPGDWLTLIPEFFLFGTAIVLLMLEAFAQKSAYKAAPWISLLGVAGAFIANALLWSYPHVGFGGMLVNDAFGVLVKAAILFGTGLTILISVNYVRREDLPESEYYALMLLSVIGMFLLVSSGNLIMIFLSLEMLSIALYVLTGIARLRPKSQEAGMKYFLLGSFSAAILVYGVALIYGAMGTLDLAAIARELTSPGAIRNPLISAGEALVIVGLAFKVAVVPFQMWTPDVYEGAPSTVTAFMSIGSKAAAFAALARVLDFSLTSLRPEWIAAIWTIAALTMFLGNIVAIAQDNIKRMLAYSSIAHAGYILAAIAASNALGIQSIPFYLVSYAFMNLGAWAVVTAVTKRGEESVDLADYSGLFWSRPWLAGAMGLFMFALAGLPPTSGFTSKLYVITAALQARMIWLVVILIVTTIISAYFYLRVTVLMFMQRPKEPPVVSVPWPLGIAVVIAAAATIWLFLFPNTTSAFTDIVARLLL